MIVAVDFPGHGLSSHVPQGVSYSDLNYAMDIKRVARYLNWSQFTLMGHSLGGYVSIYYASLFPDEVKRVISVDVVKPLTFKPEVLATAAAEGLNKLLDTEERLKKIDRELEYSYDEAVERMVEGHKKLGELSYKGARVLLRRGSKVVSGHESEFSLGGDSGGQVKATGYLVLNGGGVPSTKVRYMFTRDPRIRALIFNRLDVHTVENYINNMKCELLIVQAFNGIKLDPDDVTAKFLEQFKRVSKRFEHVMVEGHHHVHLCDAQNVSDDIDRFLSNKNSTD